MKLSVEGANLIKNFEGLRLEAYYCSSGKLTVGFGHTGPDVRPGMVITREQADKLFEKDIEKFVGYVNRLVKVPLKQHQFDVLVSFVFNVGGTNFLGSTLLRVLNSKYYEAVPAQLIKWVFGDKRGPDGRKMPIAGLVKRRAQEATIWRDGY